MFLVCLLLVFACFFFGLFSFCLSVSFLKKKRKKGCGLGWWVCWKELVGVGSREASSFDYESFEHIV